MVNINTILSNLNIFIGPTFGPSCHIPQYTNFSNSKLDINKILRDYTEFENIYFKMRVKNYLKNENF